MLESGRSAMAAGDYGRAELAYSEALRTAPGQEDAEIGLAEVQMAQGHAVEAEASLARLAASAKTATQRARALEGRGLALLRLRRLPEAEEAFLAASAADQNSAGAWNGLGQVYDARENWAQAQAAYDRALVLRPNWPAALNNFGMSLLRAGDPRRAELSFARALALAPDLETVDMNLRLAVAAQGRYAEAVSGSASVRRADILNNVGYVALLRGDSDEAAKLLQEALSISPSLHRPARQNFDFLQRQGTVSIAALTQ